MTETAWIRVHPEVALESVRESIRGVDLSVAISPYDLPEAFRGFYVKDRGIFRIEFRYGDQEPSESRKEDQFVTVELGQYSKKLLAIEVAVDQHDVDVVRLSINHADRTVQKLTENSKRLGARLNYRAIDEVLRKNLDNPELLATACN